MYSASLIVILSCLILCIFFESTRSYGAIYCTRLAIE
nr:MAG TPA: hypothetical protein [Caudoviricetes sp.]DAT57587.1 MAG TPA: hypothetical protein [Caudoviricetes sp.]